MDLSFLHMLNEYPLAGVMMIVMLLLVQQTVRVWRGQSDVTRIESENNKLAKQTSETVNQCSARTKEVMERLEEFIQANDVGHLSAKFDRSLQMLASLAHNQDSYQRTLDRVAELCHDIDRDLRGADDQLAHANILSKVDALEKLLEDVKRISIAIAGKA